MRKKAYIYIKGSKIYVDDNVYKEYKKYVNYEAYLKYKDIKNRVFTFSDFEFNIIDNIVDCSKDTYYQVERKIEIENLHKILGQLDTYEKEIIYLIYYKEETLRNIAKIKNISTKKIFNIKKNILKKLRKLLDKLNKTI